MLELERPPPFVLDKAPLVQAIAQVQFPQIARLVTLAGVAPIQDALLEALPYMQQVDVQELQVAFGPAGVSPQARSNKVTVFTDDDGWKLEVAAGAATLTAASGAYRSAENFASRFERSLNALAAIPGLSRCTRIGVRYVNIVPVPEGSLDWAHWFRPELLGWAQPQLLAATTELTAMVTETRANLSLGGPLAWASKAESVVRHGYAPRGSVLPMNQPLPLEETSFLLDLDLFVTERQAWDSAQLVDEYRVLHAEIERFFFWSLTDKGKEEFGFRIVGA